MRELRVLFVDDSEKDMESAAWELGKNGFLITRELRVNSRESLRPALQNHDWDMVIGDFFLNGFDGLEALQIVRDNCNDMPYIFFSRSGGEDLAVAALKAGANDFILKKNLERLPASVEKELRAWEEKRRVREMVKSNEEQRRLSQRMETVGRLAGGIAHDFNNILSVVSGYANLLQMKLAKTGTAHKELAEIEKAVMKATTLVRQLLSFSRRQVVKPQLLDMGALLTESLTILRMVLGEDVLLETEIAPGLSPVMADRGQMEQVIMNLAINAKDAMPKGGKLCIALSMSELGPDDFREGDPGKSGEYVRLMVKDGGCGMEADVLPRIFDPFFTTKAEGRGMGLSTVFGIVHQAGGHIRVESGPNAGSTFWIFLPRSFQPVSDAGPSQVTVTRKLPEGGESILLVEDDVDLRKLTKDVLVLEGYRVLECNSYKEAIGFAQAKELKIDLLLSDLIMPHINGFDLAESVLAHRPSLKVLFMSGYSQETVFPGANWPREPRFLEKPFTSMKLLSKIRSVLDEEQELVSGETLAGNPAAAADADK